MNSVHKAFFFLLLLFLPTQLGFHFWPDWAMVLGRRVDYLSPTIYLTDILLFLTVLLWLIESSQRDITGITQSVILWLHPRIQLKKILDFRLRWNDRVVPGVLLFCFLLINILIAKNTHVALYKLLKAGEFALLGWYIVKTKPPLSAIATPLFIGVFYSSILAIAQFVLQHSIGGPFWFLGERTFSVDTQGISRFHFCQLSTVNCQLLLRPYATFPHPNVLGGFLTVVLPLTVLRYLSILGNRRKKIIYFYGSVLAAGVFALLLTFSRNAIVAGAAAIILMIARRKQHVVNGKFFFVVIGILLLGTYYYLLTTNSSSESIVVRQQLNNSAISLWRQSPLVGVGIGNFLVKLPKILPSKSVYFLQPVHNIYLLILAETGVVGFILFCWLIWKVFLHPFSIYHLSFIILLTLGLADHYPLSLQQGQLLFTILIALSIVN